MTGPPGSLDGDINADGAVNQADRSLLTAAWGRNATEPPTVPTAGGPSCGDWNDDGFVDQDDIDSFTAFLATNGGPCPVMECWQCPCVGDINPDGFIDEADLAVVETSLGRCLYDINQDGTVDIIDAGTVQEVPDNTCVGNPLYDLDLDVNCDGCIDRSDTGQRPGSREAGLR